MAEVRIEQTEFATQRDAIYAIRETVFIIEQAVPADIEIDELDPVARHVLAFVDGQAVGTGRITSEGRIGRMAVLADFRGLGVGRAILDALIEIGVADGASRLFLSAQCHAIPFYEKAGFVAQGQVYDEAGIDHRRMEWARRRN
ncbi:MAG: GNAT family N-acetyltransferase [Rhodobacteraceae bacterium]|nr:GNAT family N-acetyltransferase [Gammaproteobacteria bacterium]RZV98274.1 MAG: GNAT family N-acetyltransferase [Paracoccaceae bacterium]